MYVIRGQNDVLFPSLVNLGQWYENQLIINTSYIKALIVYFGVKDIDVDMLGQSGLYQLYVTGLQKPKSVTPNRIRFEVKKNEEYKVPLIPITKMEQDRTIEVVIDPVEEEIDKKVFDYDKKLSEEDLSKISALNLPKQKQQEEEKAEDRPVLSLVSLAEFYESNLDIFGKISKSILLIKRCGRLELDWQTAIENTQDTQLHINYLLGTTKSIEKLELRLSQGASPTTYGFVSPEPKQSHLSLVTP